MSPLPRFRKGRGVILLRKSSRNCRNRTWFSVEAAFSSWAGGSPLCKERQAVDTILQNPERYGQGRRFGNAHAGSAFTLE